MLYQVTTLVSFLMDRYPLFFNLFVGANNQINICLFEYNPFFFDFFQSTYVFFFFVFDFVIPKNGSGKTYTMWGPAGSMLEDPSPKGEQGLAPRIFQMLFSEIERVS